MLLYNVVAMLYNVVPMLYQCYVVVGNIIMTVMKRFYKFSNKLKLIHIVHKMLI